MNAADRPANLVARVIVKVERREAKLTFLHVALALYNLTSITATNLSSVGEQDICGHAATGVRITAAVKLFMAG